MINNLIFEAIVGSTAYGTKVDTSDIDKKGIYMCSIDDLISMGYVDQINVTKDETYWELQKFLELCSVGNPTALELLFSDDEFILKTTPQFELIRENKYKFITKKCANSFMNYGYSQINKASATGKKFNIEDSKMVYKTPFDFTYFYKKGKVYLLKDYLESNGLIQERCGLVRLDHMKDCYALYYDHNNFGYRGIIGEKSNEIRLSSVPKGETPLFLIYYNVEAYSKYMREYKEYKEWLNTRNINRFVDVINHGQEAGSSRIDGKNMSHCVRLLNVSREIAETGTFKVKRQNAEYLLQIKHGEVPLKEIMEYANNEIAGLKELYEKSNLPEEVDPVFVKELLLKIRKM
jgi:predicted nucleotidyltransferase